MTAIFHALTKPIKLAPDKDLQDRVRYLRQSRGFTQLKLCWEVPELTTQHRRPAMASPVQSKALPTIWQVPCALWSVTSDILLQAYPRGKKGGRPRSCFHKIFGGIIYRMRTGAQWNRLPNEFGDDSTVHRWLQRWCKDGIMTKVWSVPVTDCNELADVFWEWQAADTRMRKARFGGDKIGKNPTDRGS
jgi:transposase